LLAAGRASGVIPPTHLRNQADLGEYEVRQTAEAKLLPATGYGLEVDGLIKSEFVTMEGATNGARELKARFPMLQVRVYDAASKTRKDITGP
jgi:hypothetical protein